MTNQQLQAPLYNQYLGFDNHIATAKYLSKLFSVTSTFRPNTGVGKIMGKGTIPLCT